MKIAGAWLDDPAVQGICEMLESGGHSAFLVGGCVRNALLGEAVGDIDIATDARPERVIELAGVSGRHAVGTGIDHGTVTVVEAGRGFEVTTFRKDVETDGRHAVVHFADDIESDARRRDFTINAFYSIRNGTVLDPLKSLPDLTARRVRFIGEAKQRIAEDYLRILRFFRFHAWYGNSDTPPDQEGLKACHALAKGMEKLSRERIGAEMRKLLAAPNPAPVLVAMQLNDILGRILPGAEPAQMVNLRACETALGLDPDPMRRLAALGGERPETALRLSREEARRLSVLSNPSEASASALGYYHGVKTALDILCLRAVFDGHTPEMAWQADVAQGAAATFPIRAEDLMPQFQGPALGARLKELERRWIASGFELSRSALLAPDDANT